MRTLIKHILRAAEPENNVTVKGWVRTRRDSKGFSFLELNDGSCLANLQVVVDAGTPGAEHLPHLTTGAAAVIEGKLVASPAQGQKWELRANRLELVGPGRCDLSPPEKGSHGGVPAVHRPPASALESVRRGFPGPQPVGLRRPPVFPGARLRLRAHADHHRERLRGSRGNVPGDHPQGQHR